MSNPNIHFLSRSKTNGVTIEVEVQFQPNFSIPFSDQQVFTYHVKIENGNDFTIQLMRRHWRIWESNGTQRQVKGEGVIGEQPIITPGGMHQYESFCPILSPMGKMEGKYQMLRLDTKEKFEVSIPEFHLLVPEILN